MSIMNVRFYRYLRPAGAGTNAPMAQEPAIASADVATSASSAQSAAASSDANFVRVAVDVASYVEIGSDPTAAAGDIYMPAGSVEYFGIQDGDKVAAITA